MLTAIIVTLLSSSQRSASDCARGAAGELIVHRPYNNRHNDASGAREDHLE